MMDQEIKAQWTAALRSGKYSQGRAYLALGEPGSDEPSKFCCLGVLSELACEASIVTRVKCGLSDEVDSRDFAVFVYVDSDGSDEDRVLLDVVAAWAGLDNSNPNVEAYGENACLSSWNDGRDFPADVAMLESCDEFPVRDPLDFGTIADLIDAQL